MAPFARKRFGQHFLVDGGAIERIVDALGPARDEPVLEIGPGRGALTRALLRRVDRLGAVELDRDLATELAARCGADVLRLWTADVLTLPFEDVRRELARDARPLVVAGNLPYNISKPVALKLVRERHAVGRAVLMFQQEVAERLTARPDSRAYGPLTVLCGEVWRVVRLFDLPPGAFRPPPKVRSSVTVWCRRDAAAADDAGLDRLRVVLAASFARRRQTLRNNLRAAIGAEAADALLERAGLDGAARAEQLEPLAFRELVRNWPA